MTHNYLESVNCKEEWTNSKRFIPVKFDDCTPEGLLKSIVYINLHGLDKATARKKLITELMGRTRPSDEPQAQFSSEKIPLTEEPTSSEFSTELIGVFSIAIISLSINCCFGSFNSFNSFSFLCKKKAVSRGKLTLCICAKKKRVK